MTSHMDYYVFLALSVLCIGSAYGAVRKYCPGISVSDGADTSQFDGCTHIEGNLDIIYLASISDSVDTDYSVSSDYYEYGGFQTPTEDVDLTFLSSIREVSGYVRIVGVHRDISLDSLRLIRGETTLDGNALLVDGTRIGSLGLRSLREITTGGVRFMASRIPCYVETINWADFQPGLEAVMEDVVGIDGGSCDTLPSCHDECTSTGCWTTELADCQEETLVICADSCDHRCMGPGPDDCCHEECAAGCTDGSASGCYACRNLINGDECVDVCPPKMIIDPMTLLPEMNPDFRFTLGRECVRTCPDYLFGEEESCVEECSTGYMLTPNGRECVRCDGLCPKECEGLRYRVNLAGNHFDDDRFTNCTTINGNIYINQQSFDGDDFAGIPGINFDQLNQFRTVREITGHLVIEAVDHRLTILGIFENVEVIGTSDEEFFKDSKLFALIIDIPILQVADFSSLRSVGGNIYVTDTCYQNAAMFERLLADESDTVNEVSTKTCGAERCDNECTSIGCWGPNSTQCFECRNAAMEDGTCVPGCDSESQYIKMAGNSTTIEVCGQCHSECSGGCAGPLDSECSSCANFMHGFSCVPVCLVGQYVDDDQVCQRCPDFCQNGCTGSMHLIGAGGCDHCDFVLLDHEGMFMRCMQPDEMCTENHVITELSFIYPNSTACQSCDPLCKGGCSRGGDPASCVECHHHKRMDTCVRRCNSSEYSDTNKVCQSCDPSCLKCSNGTNQDCTKCRDLMVPMEDGKLRCTTGSCPDLLPYIDGANTCVSKCPEEQYYLQGTSRGCLTCEHGDQYETCIEGCPGESGKYRNGTCSSSSQKISGVQSPVKILVLVLVVILLIALIVGIIIVAWRIRRVGFMGLSNEVDLEDLSKSNDNAHTQ